MGKKQSLKAPAHGSGNGMSMLSCAIYTRKSSEEGLEQDFNSLHAQREACEAFVLSQKSLGWALVPTAYDDGGFSGGNVERPALQRLIADIEAGKVNVIVVYKVDRLTRSLADFAKLVELFDAKGVSFVSVTQQFNTTTSMGRLTLNVLLSFAQFEREVTGERIRDKIAASKRKGMWMGGVPPVGYRAHSRTLEPEEPYASRVVEIYRLYLQLNCVRKVAQELQVRGWLTPERENKRPGFGGNKPFSRGHLYRILGNPIYVGLLPHQGENHPGQHPAIVDKALWEEVQLRLKSNRQGNKTRVSQAGPSLLLGKLFDEVGRRLSPTHTKKGQKRYRYYVTSADEPGEPIRLPAADLERLVVRAIADWSADDKRVLDAVGWKDAKRAEEALKAAKQFRQAIQQTSSPKVGSCVRRVEVAPDKVRITLDLVACGLHPDKGGGGRREVSIEVPAKRRRCGMAVRLVIEDQKALSAKREPDPALVAMLAKGKVWLQQFTREGRAIEEIAEKEKFSTRYVNRVINIALLAPDIVATLERGEQPEGVNATRLLTSVPFPERWPEQREALGLES